MLFRTEEKTHTFKSTAQTEFHCRFQLHVKLYLHSCINVYFIIFFYVKVLSVH